MSCWYFEAKLAEKLGLTRADLAGIRESLLKKEAGDWKLLGREIVLSHSAVDRVVAHLIKKTGATIAASAMLACAVPQKKNGAQDRQSATPAETELVVKRLYPNAHLLLCENPRTGAEIRVWVPSNENFRPRMKLRARPQEPGKPHRLVGRCPRFGGRW